MEIRNPAWKSRIDEAGASPPNNNSANTDVNVVATPAIETGTVTKPADSYKILFVGLICFLNKRRDSRLVLLPDGTTQIEPVTPHFPYIVVDPSELAEPPQGWEGGDAQQQALIETGMFRLPKCSLSIDGVNNGKDLVTSQHDLNIPKLVEVDPEVEIDPNDANAVVRIELTSGVLEAFRRPELEDDEDDERDPLDVAIISRLTVEHAGPITVTVFPAEGGKRILRLKPGTDIALANIAFPDEGTGNEHFSIYGELTRARTINGRRPQRILRRIPALEPTHHIFSFPVHINDGGSACGNQGCCRR